MLLWSSFTQMQRKISLKRCKCQRNICRESGMFMAWNFSVRQNQLNSKGNRQVVYYAASYMPAMRKIKRRKEGKIC